MFLTDFLLAIIVAIIFSGILVGFTRRRGPGPFGGLAFFFLLIFMMLFPFYNFIYRKGIVRESNNPMRFRNKVDMIICHVSSISWRIE